MRPALFVVASTLAAVATAQSCTRPEPPPGGHAVAVDLIVPVTYSDSYQTFCSLIRPTGTPPTCGWPLVVHVHPMGQARGHDLALQLLLAGQGYAVWSYDVRGQGQAVLANLGHPQAGSTLWGPVERCDLAEQIQFVASNVAWTGIVDATRIAVVGSSQGGAHAWSAAALSQQVLAVPGRPTHTFPQIACVVPTDFVADSVDDWLRGGRLFSSWFLESINGSYQGMPFDATFLQTCRTAFIAQDPAALLASFVAEGRALSPLLAVSSVPVLYAHAYLDNVDNPLSSLLLLETKPGVNRALLGTIGHNVAENAGERTFRESLILRWLHRYLWSEANEIDVEAAHVLPELPLRQVDRDDPQHLWSRAHVLTTATPLTATRLHLHDDLALRTTPPIAPQVDGIVQQTIDPLAVTFTPLEYLNQPAVRDLQNVLTVCPLQERVYSFTITTESQLAASPSLHAQVVPQQARWMLAALLTVQPADPGADEVLLTSQAFSSFTSVAGIAESHDVRLPPIAVTIPAGATLRLRVRNLWLRELPMPHTLEVAPLFFDFRVDVVHGDPIGSWLDLPLQPVAPRLVSNRTWLELAGPLPIMTTVRGGQARAGFPYFAMVGLSGHGPAVPYLNAVIPIDADWLVIYSAASSEAPLFTGFLGFLDSNGEAHPVLDLSAVPLPQALNGYRLTLGAFVWDGAWATTGAAANPCDVMLR